MVTGPRSHITRTVYVYLPPQYFQPGVPGLPVPGDRADPRPAGRAAGLDQRGRRDACLRPPAGRERAQPAVLVMPDANGGRRISLQCLNQAGGPQDLTYLAVDLPAQIARRCGCLRRAGLGHRRLLRGRVLRRQHGPALPAPLRVRRGAQRLLRARRQPAGQPGPPGQPVRRQHRLQEQNTPLDEIQKLPAGAIIPQFWLGAGAATSRTWLTPNASGSSCDRTSQMCR